MASLDVGGEAGGDAVAVDQVIAEDSRTPEENPVGLTLREADDFVFDGGAVARADGLDLPRVHRGAVEVGADEVVSRGCGLSLAAGGLGECGEAGWTRESRVNDHPSPARP